MSELKPSLADEDQKLKLDQLRRILLYAALGSVAAVIASIVYSGGSGLVGIGDAVERDYLPFATILYRPETVQLAIEMLTALAVVAMLTERVTEVFIATSRADKRQLQVLYIDEQKKKLKDDGIDPDEAKTTQDEIDSATTDLIYYRSGTKTLAKAFALVVATLIALAGVRTLTPLLAVNYDTLNIVQWGAIQFVDVVLTVGLLVGGSSGIHKLISAMGRQVKPASERSDTEAQTQPN